VEALVDTGAITSCVPEHVAIQLNLEALEQREVINRRRTAAQMRLRGSGEDPVR